MKKLNTYITERILINKDTKINDFVNSLEELKTKYELDYTRISNNDRHYGIPDKLNKKFLKFMRHPKLEIDTILNKFIEDNNLLDDKKYNCHTIILYDYKSLTNYFYIIIHDKDKKQTVAQIIYRYNDGIRIYTEYIKIFNRIVAQIIDYIFQS